MLKILGFLLLTAGFLIGGYSSIWFLDPSLYNIYSVGPFALKYALFRPSDSSISLGLYTAGALGAFGVALIIFAPKPNL